MEPSRPSLSIYICWVAGSPPIFMLSWHFYHCSLPPVETGGDIIIKFSIFRLLLLLETSSFASVMWEGGSSPETASRTSWGWGWLVPWHAREGSATGTSPEPSWLSAKLLCSLLHRKGSGGEAGVVLAIYWWFGSSAYSSHFTATSFECQVDFLLFKCCVKVDSIHFSVLSSKYTAESSAPCSSADAF